MENKPGPDNRGDSAVRDGRVGAYMAVIVGAVNRTDGGVIFGEGCKKGACPCFPIILPRPSRTYPKVVGLIGTPRLLFSKE